jgi:hypothetical protein
VVSAASKKRRTMASALTNHAWIHDITCALTVLVLMHRQRLQNVHTNTDAADTYWWQWEASGEYSCH